MGEAKRRREQGTPARSVETPHSYAARHESAADWHARDRAARAARETRGDVRSYDTAPQPSTRRRGSTAVLLALTAMAASGGRYGR